MRHINRKIHNHWRGPHAATTPYCICYINAYKNSGFKCANSKNRYVKILQYIADHDGCKRVDVIRDVYRYKNVDAKDSCYKNMRACRGQGSTVFSQLLYLDVIDYDKSFCYHITDRGREVLKTAYINDCVKLVNNCAEIAKKI